MLYIKHKDEGCGVICHSLGYQRDSRRSMPDEARKNQMKAGLKTKLKDINANSGGMQRTFSNYMTLTAQQKASLTDYLVKSGGISEKNANKIIETALTGFEYDQKMHPEGRVSTGDARFYNEELYNRLLMCIDSFG